MYMRIMRTLDKDPKNAPERQTRKLNPDIKIYPMTIDPEAFKLKELIIENNNE